ATPRAPERRSTRAPVAAASGRSGAGRHARPRGHARPCAGRRLRPRAGRPAGARAAAGCAAAVLGALAHWSRSGGRLYPGCGLPPADRVRPRLRPCRPAALTLSAIALAIAGCGDGGGSRPALPRVVTLGGPVLSAPKVLPIVYATDSGAADVQ